MNSKVKALLDKLNIIQMNSERFQEENHEMDNRVLFHLFDLAHGYQWQDIVRWSGYTEHPAYLEWNGPGLMFECEDGTEFWIHGQEDQFDYDLWKVYFKEDLAEV